jgi:hypothetical protein
VHDHNESVMVLTALGCVYARRKQYGTLGV